MHLIHKIIYTKVHITPCTKAKNIIIVSSKKRSLLSGYAIYPQSFYMMFTYLYDTARNCGFIDGVHQEGYIYQQKFSLVNIKLK